MYNLVMEFTKSLVKGKLIKRYKRFFTDVKLGKEVVTSHCPNTGSMKGLLDEGNEVYLMPNDNPKRKLKYGLEIIKAKNNLIGVNTHMANRIVQHALENNLIKELTNIDLIKPEVFFNKETRFDFFLKKNKKKIFLEVKNVTLFRNKNTAEFPDAITSRGSKHLLTLIDAKKDGYDPYLLFAGTAWLFSDEALNQKLDYLFIDEAGQVSLANTLAVSTSTKNIVLIGDQMQLSQPIKGTHPGIGGKSSLEYLLEGYDTIPPEKGIFLNETRRLNENICEFVSSSFYDSRLKPHPITKERYVQLNLDEISDAGINYIPMSHENNSQKSNEESDYIKELLNKIIGKKCKDNNKSKERVLDLNDILIVAPFNMQVNNLSRNLPKNSKVGTIDKFQGQEAKIVFISMTASDPENIPRHKSFFFSRNRLNVGVSRAECITIILFNPNLLNTSCQKIDEMKLINNYCKLLKYEIKK